MGQAARNGRDKITFSASRGIAGLGAWLEQLIAESLGKQGVGLIPIDEEPPASPETYGADRLFCDLRLGGEDQDGSDGRLTALEQAGRPVVRIGLAGPEGLFQEFVRWELATAVAGAVMGVDPFDQPDVEASKLKTRALTDAYEAGGALPAEAPIFEDAGIALYADQANAAVLTRTAASPTLEGFLAAHFMRAEAGDYLAILAYLDRNPTHRDRLQALRRRLGATGSATVVQFGPRFLHSTGQAYKGGPSTGVFLQITAQPAEDVPVPGRGLSFGVIEAAQAEGDLAVLAERGRRLLRVHLGDDTAGGVGAVDRGHREGAGRPRLSPIGAVDRPRCGVRLAPSS